MEETKGIITRFVIGRRFEFSFFELFCSGFGSKHFAAGTGIFFDKYM